MLIFAIGIKTLGTIAVTLGEHTFSSMNTEGDRRLKTSLDCERPPAHAVWHQGQRAYRLLSESAK